MIIKVNSAFRKRKEEKNNPTTTKKTHKTVTSRPMILHKSNSVYIAYFELTTLSLDCLFWANHPWIDLVQDFKHQSCLF